MLTALAERKIRLTFFLTGRWVEENPDLTRAIRDGGHEIANHTYTHPDLRGLGHERIISEINRTEQLLLERYGVSSRPWFRFPYGARDARTMTIINELGYTSIFWTLDSLDSVGAPKTPQFLHDRVVGNAVNGSIVLMHVGSASTAVALPRIIDSLQQRGYRLVTISELLR